MPYEQKDWFGGQTELYDQVTKQLTVPAQDSVVIDLLVNLKSSCLIPPPTNWTYTTPLGQGKSVSVNSPDGCSNPPPSSKVARCQTDTCLVRDFELASAITSLTLSTKPGAVAFVEYFLPGHYDWANQAEQPLAVQHTFSATDLPTDPE